MENHSYDNYFGALDRSRRRTARRRPQRGRPTVGACRSHRLDVDRARPARSPARAGRRPTSNGPTAPTAGSCAAPNGSRPCSTTTRSPPAPTTSWGTGTPSSSPSTRRSPAPSRSPTVGSDRASARRFPNRRFLVAGTAHGLATRRAGEVLRPTDQRNDLRPADPPRDRLGELPQHLPGAPRRLPAARPRRAAGHRQARPDRPPAPRRGAPRAGVQAAVHGRRLRDQRAGARPPRARHEAVLPRRGDRHDLPAFSIVDPSFVDFSEETAPGHPASASDSPRR